MNLKIAFSVVKVKSRSLGRYRGIFIYIIGFGKVFVLWK